MSQIDVRNAKLALAARLRDWGITGDAAFLAGGFIDDLVTQGWQMAPFRETRPQPATVATACATCGGDYGKCCDDPVPYLTRPTPSANYPDHAQTARDMLRTSQGIA